MFALKNVGGVRVMLEWSTFIIIAPVPFIGFVPFGLQGIFANSEIIGLSLYNHSFIHLCINTNLDPSMYQACKHTNPLPSWGFCSSREHRQYVSK